MSLFVVDATRCTRDGACVAECPARIIELQEGAPTPTPVSGAEAACIRCGHCVAVCPHGALALASIRPEDCPPVQNDLALTAAQAEYAIRSRRSIRTYRDEAVEREKLARLIDIARYAPTGSNRQEVRWLVINSRDEVERLASMVVDMARHISTEGAVSPVPSRLASLAKVILASGAARVSRNAPVLIVAYAPKQLGMSLVDCSIALSYLDLAAPPLGLGACWAGYFMTAIDQWPPLQAALALPEGYAGFGAILLGYPTYRYHRLPPRDEAQITWRE